jgi:hypothetical protein
VLDRDQIETAETIEELHAHVARLAALGHAGIAQAVREMAEAVLRREELATQERHHMLSRLEHLSRIAMRPPGERIQSHLIHAIWNALGTSLEARSSLADKWQVCGPKIGAFFGF